MCYPLETQSALKIHNQILFNNVGSDVKGPGEGGSEVDFFIVSNRGEC